LPPDGASSFTNQIAAIAPGQTASTAKIDTSADAQPVCVTSDLLMGCSLIQDKSRLLPRRRQLNSKIAQEQREVGEADSSVPIQISVAVRI
jgi:hypothetical protein